MAAKKRFGADNNRNKVYTTNNGKSKHCQNRAKSNGFLEDSDITPDCGSKWPYKLLIIGLALFFGWCHRNHIAAMFERDRHFSHLSDLERELTFRTEMGLYYSYYKTVVRAPSFSAGVHAIMNCNLTEYPSTINTLKRFNLYPEVVLGGMFRVFSAVTQHLGVKTHQCWTVNRGEGLSPVTSCEGVGDPMYFYIENIFALNGVNMAVFFLFGTYLSGSVYGGLITVVSFFFNHGECTRVQWTPPLRESFAFTFSVLNMFVVTHILRCREPPRKTSLILAASVVCFMLPWQFAQFTLMTQTVAVFACYVLTYIGSYKMRIYLAGQGLGLAVSYVCLFGNEMLVTSFFTSCLLSVAAVVTLEPLLERLPHRMLIWAVQGVLWLGGTLGIKLGLGRALNIQDDAHIGDLLRSKFTNFRNFHTMLYTCAAEFDFLGEETWWQITKTLLLPMATLAIVIVAAKLVYQECVRWRSAPATSPSPSPATPTHRGEEASSYDALTSDVAGDAMTSLRSKPHAELLFHVLQLAAYTVMAVLIMRLKLFWTPQLCLISSVLASRALYPSWLLSQRQRAVVLVGLLAVGSVGGYANLSKQWGIMGEFSNLPMEQMVEWVNTRTPQAAVFAGSMPTMATIKLTTQRPVVMHPHYEDAGLRERVWRVYRMFSRADMSEVWHHMVDMQVDFVILEMGWCSRANKPGCKMEDVYDLEDSKNRHKSAAVCHEMKRKPAPWFTNVFSNSGFDILKVNKNPRTR